MKIFNAFLKAFPSYLNIVLLNYIMLALLRLWELLMSGATGAHMLQGLTGDVLIAHVALLVLYIPFALLWQWKSKMALLITGAISLLFHIFWTPVVAWFFINHDLLSAMSHGCSLCTSWVFALKNTPAIQWLMPMLGLLVAGSLALGLIWRRNFIFAGWLAGLFALLMALSVPLTFEPGFATRIYKDNPLIQNKAFYLLGTGYHCLRGDYTQESSTLSANEIIKAVHPESSFAHPNDFPLLRSHAAEGCLSRYFSAADTPPNIVLVIVQGLGTQMLDPQHEIHFMPFLRELAEKSLYWPNFMATSVRHQNNPAALLGGLPQAEGGFSNIPLVPYHFSLVNVLRENQYHTSYHSGQWAWFNATDRLLERSSIDNIYDAGSFPLQYQKVIVGDDNYFWGYNDKDLLNWYLQNSQQQRSPRFNILQTGSMHSPFAMDTGGGYLERLQAVISNAQQQAYFAGKENWYASQMYTDDALRSFFEASAQLPSFSNTIFVVTGNFPMAELAPQHPLKKYNVPLIIYSPLLQEAQRFNSIASHNDLYETLIGLLQKQYGLRIPAWTTSAGKEICPDAHQDTEVLIPLINQGSAISELVWGKHFLNQEGEVFVIGDNLQTTPLTDDEDLVNKMKSILEALKNSHNQSAIALMPDSIYFDYFGYDVLIDTLFAAQRVRNEYRNIIEDLPLENATHFIDISFTSPEISLDEVYVVYELRNAHDSILQWDNFGIPVKKEDFSIRIRLDQQNFADGETRLQVFLWNESPVPYSFGGVRTVLYRQDSE